MFYEIKKNRSHFMAQQQQHAAHHNSCECTYKQMAEQLWMLFVAFKSCFGSENGHCGISFLDPRTTDMPIFHELWLCWQRVARRDTISILTQLARKVPDFSADFNLRRRKKFLFLSYQQFHIVLKNAFWK